MAIVARAVVLDAAAYARQGLPIQGKDAVTVCFTDGVLDMFLCMGTLWATASPEHGVLFQAACMSSGMSCASASSNGRSGSATSSAGIWAAIWKTRCNTLKASDGLVCSALESDTSHPRPPHVQSTKMRSISLRRVNPLHDDLLGYVFSSRRVCHRHPGHIYMLRCNQRRRSGTRAWCCNNRAARNRASSSGAGRSL